ncbi:MAG: hypothetical protein Kow0098_06800 [Ignavibacteriaceae bacterium]
MNLNLFPKIFSIFLAASVSLVYLQSCSCSSCGNQEAEVPFEVLNSANKFIISKTGKEFFDKYITPDFYHTSKDSIFYNLVYRLYDPEKPFVDGIIKFSVDTTGRINYNREITGIPECLSDQRNCEFNIDEQTAINIAAKDGLEEGIKEWKTGFIWDPKYGRYVWHILSTIKEIPGEAYKASGKEIIIDPYSGEIIARNEWNIR